MVFCSTSMKNTHMFILAGATVWGVGTFSPCLHGFSLGTPVSSHIPKMGLLDGFLCVHCPSLRECGGCEWPCEGRVFCPGWVLPCTPSYQERLQPPMTLTQKSAGWKRITLFLFTFLKYICIAHIYFTVYDQKCFESLVLSFFLCSFYASILG